MRILHVFRCPRRTKRVILHPIRLPHAYLYGYFQQSFGEAKRIPHPRKSMACRNNTNHERHLADCERRCHGETAACKLRSSHLVIKLLLMKFYKVAITLICCLTMFTANTPVVAQKTVGDATYYSNRSHGRRTSSGILYHKDSLTCAHRTLPFGTKLIVRNPKNGCEVVVKVTDRGPFRKGAIVDLSYAAARQLGMIQQGVARVEVTEYKDAPNLVAPSLSKDGLEIKGLNLYDPATAKYYSSNEWDELNTHRQQEYREKKAEERRNMAHAKANVPSWKIVNEHMTAKRGK